MSFVVILVVLLFLGFFFSSSCYRFQLEIRWRGFFSFWFEKWRWQSWTNPPPLLFLLLVLALRRSWFCVIWFREWVGEGAVTMMMISNDGEGEEEPGRQTSGKREMFVDKWKNTGNKSWTMIDLLLFALLWMSHFFRLVSSVVCSFLLLRSTFPLPFCFLFVRSGLFFTSPIDSLDSETPHVPIFLVLFISFFFVLLFLFVCSCCCHCSSYSCIDSDLASRRPLIISSVRQVMDDSDLRVWWWWWWWWWWGGGGGETTKQKCWEHKETTRGHSSSVLFSGPQMLSSTHCESFRSRRFSSLSPRIFCFLPLVFLLFIYHYHLSVFRCANAFFS